MAIMLLPLTALLGCDSLKRVFDTLDSTRETPQTIDRKWDIHEPERKFLMVMVHGFNSSKEAAWGEFPSLITNEKNSKFARFNVIRYGYSSSVCRNKVEISVLGDGLRSFLIDEIKSYHGVIFVAHSMGGLVVEQALTILARDNNSDLDRLPIIVMTFGTPHLGVQGADKLEHLSFLCTDKQAEAMEAFSESLSSITADWNAFFKKQAHSRFNYHVTMKKYYGPDDRFVSRASACGGDISDCEQVEGNHAMIVKPRDPDHLAYRKLLSQISNLVSASDGMRPMVPSDLRIESIDVK
jgi:pimeloyl-ACP methyl ester carboxylesterase